MGPKIDLDLAGSQNKPDFPTPRLKFGAEIKHLFILKKIEKLYYLITLKR